MTDFLKKWMEFGYFETFPVLNTLTNQNPQHTQELHVFYMYFSYRPDPYVKQKKT